MRFLVDANILSEPTKHAPAAAVVGWLRANERDLAVNPIILGELEYGILLLPEGRRRARLEQWFAQPRMRRRLRPERRVCAAPRCRAAWHSVAGRRPERRGTGRSVGCSRRTRRC